jgi:molybdopterin-guanine dinucleotide biosynthesis protein A
MNQEHIFSRPDGVILAGGRNSRIQTRKALLAVSGRTIVERIITAIRPSVGEILLIANEPEAYSHLDLPIARDILPGGGPLSGVHAGLSLSQSDHILVTACDMPFVNPALVRYLIACAERHPEAHAVVPHWAKGTEPLHAIYDRRCLPQVEQRIKAGELRISAFLESIPTFRVELDDWAAERGVDLGAAFMNVNTWPEWQVAEALANGVGGA